MVPETYYQEQVQHREQAVAAAQKVTQHLVLARVISFLLLVVAVYVAIVEWPLAWVAVVILLGLFIFLIQYHARVKDQLAYQEALLKINQQELQALKHEYGQFPDGEEFQEPEHFYLQDLDIFGPGSVFQYVNRTATTTGKQQLAQWFKVPFQEKPDITQQQEAVGELSRKNEWRQDFQAAGYLYPEDEDEKTDLIKWAQHPQPVVNTPLLKAALYVVPALTLLLLIAMLVGWLPFGYFLIYLFVVPFGITAARLKAINHLHQQVSKQYKSLEKYGHLLHLIEKEEWQSQRLVVLQDSIQENGVTASTAIQQLARFISLLDNRLNMIAALVLNGLFLWDLHLSQRIVQWQRSHQQELPQWINVIGQFDGMVSLATLRFNQPAFVFPQVEMEELTLEGQNLGHLLLRADERVNNSFSLKGWGQIVLITGANMAGKSTFLRTVGLNIVMGMMGAPVCGTSFRFSPVQVFTSMRMKDSLQKHESYFFAELKRLQQMIHSLRAGQKLFIILDEILKGTNTRDQHEGSEALIRQLTAMPASGIIATHDLSLGKLAEVLPGHLRNMRFEIEIENGEMQFDYKLKEGVSQNLNASFLLRKMGIVQ